MSAPRWRGSEQKPLAALPGEDIQKSQRMQCLPQVLCPYGGETERRFRCCRRQQIPKLRKECQADSDTFCAIVSWFLHTRGRKAQSC
jgi:hypothetical protein